MNWKPFEGDKSLFFPNKIWRFFRSARVLGFEGQEERGEFGRVPLTFNHVMS
jgi:hypothetical protein